MNPEEIKTKEPQTLTETLFELEKLMSGEARNLISNDGDVILSLQFIQGQLFFTSCKGIWRFNKAENGIESTVQLEVFVQ